MCSDLVTVVCVGELCDLIFSSIIRCLHQEVCYAQECVMLCTFGLSESVGFGRSRNCKEVGKVDR